mmetsp:Transcript_22652/g.57733  ORF Transcript_22652/g.57733 Transcript_22652/m.57733 type:complete len:406 (-) Transcript_22652:298-1515(-)
MENVHPALIDTKAHGKLKRWLMGRPKAKKQVLKESLFQPCPYTFSADIYSCGIVLCFLLFGQTPFRDEDASRTMGRLFCGIETDPAYKEWKDYISEDALDLIHKLSSFVPEDRITAEEAVQHPFFAGRYLYPPFCLLLLTPYSIICAGVRRRAQFELQYNEQRRRISMEKARPSSQSGSARGSPPKSPQQFSAVAQPFSPQEEKPANAPATLICFHDRRDYRVPNVTRSLPLLERGVTSADSEQSWGEGLHAFSDGDLAERAGQREEQEHSILDTRQPVFLCPNFEQIQWEEVYPSDLAVDRKNIDHMSSLPPVGSHPPAKFLPSGVDILDAETTYGSIHDSFLWSTMVTNEIQRRAVVHRDGRKRANFLTQLAHKVKTRTPKSGRVEEKNRNGDPMSVSLPYLN